MTTDPWPPEGAKIGGKYGQRRANVNPSGAPGGRHRLSRIRAGALGMV